MNIRFSSRIPTSSLENCYYTIKFDHQKSDASPRGEPGASLQSSLNRPIKLFSGDYDASCISRLQSTEGSSADLVTRFCYESHKVDRVIMAEFDRQYHDENDR